MTFPVFHGIKLAANSYIENLRIESLAADPTGAALSATRVWHNSVSNVFKYAVSDGEGGFDIYTFATAEDLSAAVSALEGKIDTVEASAGLETNGSFAAHTTSNYMNTATSLKGSDVLLDSALKGVDDRLVTVEGAFINKNGSVAFTADQSMGSNKLTNLATPTASTDAATKGYVDTRVDALGAAFNYVGTVNGGVDGAAAYDMNSLPSGGKDTGDYYKVATAGFFKIGAEGTPFYANLNDGLVWNNVGGIDIIDNTNSTVSGTADFISVTGAADTGFVVDIDTDFKGRMTTAETDIGALETGVGVFANLTTTATTVVGAINELDAEIGTMSSLTTTATTVVGAINELDSDIGALKTSINNTRFTYNSTTGQSGADAGGGGASTAHTITHNLNTPFVSVNLWVYRDDKWKNDIAAITQTSANALTVDLTTSADILVVVQSLADLA